jgi:uncharacterized protein YcbX
LSAIVVADLFRYPVKSLAGTRFASLAVDRRGPRLDRHWMVVDPSGAFLTQRRYPRMCLVQAQVEDPGEVLRLEAPGMAPLRVAGDDGGDLPVEIWNDRLTARTCGAEADAWLSEFLDTRCRLVCLPASETRVVDQRWAAPRDEVGFADGFPFLLVSRAALDALNTRLDAPVAMSRFRPNVVVDGCPAHAEDEWKRIRIGGIEFRVAKACSRCTVPTVDPATGERQPGLMRVLTSYRRRDREVTFGQNLLHDGPGELAVGMTVEVLA